MLAHVAVKRHGKGVSERGEKVGGRFAPGPVADAPAGAGDGLTLSDDGCEAPIDPPRAAMWELVGDDYAWKLSGEDYETVLEKSRAEVSDFVSWTGAETAYEMQEAIKDRLKTESADHADGGRAWRAAHRTDVSLLYFLNIAELIENMSQEALAEDDLTDLETTRQNIAGACNGAYRIALREMLVGVFESNKMDDVVHAAEGRWDIGSPLEYRDTAEARDARAALDLIADSNFADADTATLEDAIRAHWRNTTEVPDDVASRRIAGDVNGLKTIAASASASALEDVRFAA